MYIHESHMGGFYATEEPLDPEALYCETCGDSDRFVGIAKSFGEGWAALKGEVSLFGSGGVAAGYAYPFLCATFPDDVAAAGALAPETDGDGFCDMGDARILEEIGKIVGEKPRLFRCARDGDGYCRVVAAEDAGAAKAAFALDYACAQACGREPEPVETSFDEIDGDGRPKAD